MKSVIKPVAQTIFLPTFILSLLGLFSGFYLLADLASHFRGHYFLAACFTSLVFISCRAMLLSVLSTAVLVLNLVFILPWYMPDSENASQTGQVKLKLLLSNVLGSNTAHEHFISLTEVERPEIVVVLEVDERWVRALSAMEPRYPYRLTVPRENNFGIGVYSKLPIQAASTRYFCESGIPSLVLTLAAGERTFTLIATHPLPPLSGSWYRSRNTHIGNIAKQLTSISGPILLAGDLNTTMWSAHYQTLEASGVLRNARQGFGIQPTWPAYLPILGIPIDHILASEHFRVLDFKTGPNVGSDHLPVIVELAL